MHVFTPKEFPHLRPRRQGLVLTKSHSANLIISNNNRTQDADQPATNKDSSWVRGKFLKIVVYPRFVIDTRKQTFPAANKTVVSRIATGPRLTPANNKQSLTWFTTQMDWNSLLAPFSLHQVERIATPYQQRPPAPRTGVLLPNITAPQPVVTQTGVQTAEEGVGATRVVHDDQTIHPR